MFFSKGSFVGSIVKLQKYRSKVQYISCYHVCYFDEANFTIIIVKNCILIHEIIWLNISLSINSFYCYSSLSRVGCHIKPNQPKHVKPCGLGDVWDTNLSTAKVVTNCCELDAIEDTKIIIDAWQSLYCLFHEGGYLQKRNMKYTCILYNVYIYTPLLVYLNFHICIYIYVHVYIYYVYIFVGL